jgi:hypothetical protein
MIAKLYCVRIFERPYVYAIEADGPREPTQP